MKKTLFAIALISFVSCTKKPVCTPAVFNNLSGCWFGSNSKSACFTDSLVSINTQPFHAYNIYNDTIHIGLLIESYKFLISMDTLFLVTVRNKKIDTFYKNN